MLNDRRAMELQRGICVLCKENNKVLNPSDAEEFIDLIPQVINKRFVLESEFQKLRNGVKLCTICCYKLKITNDIRKAIKSVKLPDETVDQVCRFCRSEDNVIFLKNDWKYFTERTEGYLELSEFPVTVCPKCFFYFDTIFNFKNNLLYKYPQLCVNTKPSPKSVLRNNNDTPRNSEGPKRNSVSPKKESHTRKSTDTPRRKSQSKSPPSAKKRKIFDNCFNYLQPLCTNDYLVNKKVKRDVRMYNKVPYVDLSGFVKETPKTRPIIKIKLKPKHKKSVEIIQINNYTGNSVERIRNSTKTSSKSVSKSEDVSRKNMKIKSRRPLRRNSSYTEKRDASEDPLENIDDTPKAPANANLVPKRRVSHIIESTNEPDAEEEKIDTEEQPENLANKSNEEISKIVEKYIENEKYAEEKLDLFEEIEKNVEESEKDGKSNGNGLVETTNEDLFNNVNGDEAQSDDKNNGENLENDPCLSGTSKEVLNESESPDITETYATKPYEEDRPFNEDSYSEDSEKERESDKCDDAFNGPERKKKRVTFSI